MTDHPVPTTPRNLLSTTRDLTRQVRLTQRGAWFPLAVLSAVTLGAIPFYRYGHHTAHCTATGREKACLVYPSLALWYWPIALLIAYAVISWFYVRSSRGRGVGTRVQPYVVVGVVLGLLSTPWLLWANTHPAFLAATLHLGTSQATNIVYRVASPASAIGVALLVLAWIERNRALLALTVAYVMATIPGIHIGSFSHPSPWAFLPHLLLDGGVLLLEGITLAVVQRTHRRPSAA